MAAKTRCSLLLIRSRRGVFFRRRLR